MDAIKNLIQQAVAIDSVWSIVTRGVIWVIISVIIIVSMDNPNADLAQKNLKANLGFFIIFMLLSGGLIYLLFGFQQG
ncbi:MAG: hypothetical protein GX559_00930 [Candidatus Pacebacteria bacterium]|nr:hypothetical protein [Candidatus Paceibacterota bacterium]